MEVESIYTKISDGKIHQGDIIEDVEVTTAVIKDGKPITTQITYPYAVIMTQECDLEQDYSNRNNEEKVDEDKYLQSILLCPVYIAEMLKEGKHLAELEINRMYRNSAMWSIITRNNEKRFHYLKSCEKSSMVALAIDFKEYFTLMRDEVYDLHSKQYKISLDKIFRENLSHRFTHYLSRIGLPNIKK